MTHATVVGPEKAVALADKMLVSEVQGHCTRVTSLLSRPHQKIMRDIVFCVFPKGRFASRAQLWMKGVAPVLRECSFREVWLEAEGVWLHPGCEPDIVNKWSAVVAADLAFLGDSVYILLIYTTFFIMVSQLYRFCCICIHLAGEWSLAVWNDKWT